MSRLTLCLFAALLVAAALPAIANPGDNTSASAIRAQQAQIAAELADRKGRFKDLDAARKAELQAHQTTVLSRLVNVEQTTELPETDQIAVFNALEAIEAIVNQAEDERMVCERYKPVGSNRPTTVCKTVAQRRAEKQVAEQNLSRDQQCVDGWAGGFCKN
ncbi:hypothetical protein [Cognatilysobacter tabacisoli]|uniref:hypothetical protein n=1 Tax=Cognatilysobacter tabacisoli TaxID=2315424 RepID=UPI0013006C76|nr:hypothetical protein [Lysobacter tabacisoli]